MEKACGIEWKSAKAKHKVNQKVKQKWFKWAKRVKTLQPLNIKATRKPTQANCHKMHTIMLEQQGENEFEVFDLPISDVTKLLVKQDLNITNINSQTIKCVHTNYLAVIKALFNLGYYQDGKDQYYSDCTYLVKNFPVYA